MREDLTSWIIPWIIHLWLNSRYIVISRAREEQPFTLPLMSTLFFLTRKKSLLHEIRVSEYYSSSRYHVWYHVTVCLNIKSRCPLLIPATMMLLTADQLVPTALS